VLVSNVLLSGAALAALLPWLVGGAPSAAVASSPVSACDDSTGVTVVVDFAGLGGGIQVRCAGWPVASGLDALAKAGFDVDLVLTQPGFVCRIDGVPADDPCQVTPPGDAYWAYYEADRGGDWHYSMRGPGATHPEAGSVEGWAFGGGGKPGVPPPPPYEQPTQPPSTQPPSTQPPSTQPPSTQPPSTQPPSTQPASTQSPPMQSEPPPGTSPVSTPQQSSPPASQTAPPSSVPTGTVAPDASSPTVRAGVGTSSSSASPIGAAIAVGAIVVIGGAAGVTAWRRRRLGESQ
jgi:hypothetical protein